MKKLMAVLLAGLIVLGTLSACSESTSQNAQPDSADSADNTVTQDEPVTIGFSSWESGEVKELEAAAIDRYMELNPHITIEAEFIPYDDYTAKLNTLLAAGGEPDVYSLQEYYTLQYGQEGMLVDIAPYYEEIGIDPQERFLPGGAAFTDDGALYGLNSIVAGFVLYYNKDLFEAHNIETPPTDPSLAWNWDEFVEVAKQLTFDINGNNATSESFDKDNIVTYGTMPQGNSWLTFMPILYSAGGSFGSEDGMSSALTTPETIDAVTKLNDLMNVHHVAPTAALIGGMPTMEAMMANGQLSMFWGGLWNIFNLDEANANYGIAPIPSIQSSTTISWASHDVITIKSEYKQEAFDFVAYFSDPEATDSLLAVGFPTDKEYLTKYPNALDSEFGEEHAKIIIDILTQTAVVPENVTLKNFSQIADQNYVPAMDKVWYGELTPEEGLAELEEATKELFQGRWDR